MSNMSSSASGLSGSDLNSMLTNMSQSDQKEMQQFIQNESQKATVHDSVHNLTAMCFKKCINSKISSGQLDKYEEPCIQNCVQRYMDANMLTLKHLEKMRTQ